jgi:hypothetical protein
MYWLLRGKRDSWLNLSKPVQVLNFEKLRGLNFVFVFFLTWKYMTNGRLNHRDQSKKDKRIMDRSDARATAMPSFSLYAHVLWCSTG